MPPELEDFKPSGYGERLRDRASQSPRRGHLRGRAGKNPKRGFLIAKAKKRPVRGYLVKRARAARQAKLPPQ